MGAGRRKRDMDLHAILGDGYARASDDERINDDWDSMDRDISDKFVEETVEMSPDFGKRKEPIVGNIILFIIAAALCLAVALITPAALVLQNDDKIVDTRKASVDIQNGLDSLKTNVISASMDLPKVYLLPLSNDGGTKFNKSRSSTYKDENGTTHSVYEDPTIKVDVWKTRGKVKEFHYDANYARVKIAHPTQLRTAISTTGFANRSRVQKIAVSKNAILATNGDFYKIHKYGISVKQGTVYRKAPFYSHSLFIDDNGDFKMMTSDEALASNYLETHNIYNVLTFGPALVVDGEIFCKQGYDTARNPRTGIGQLGPLEYLVITVEGRTGRSAGVDLPDFAEMFYKAGCSNAYNLDGGQSATMVFLDKVYNRVSNNGERLVTDILYFASAYPEGGEE